MVIDNVPLPPAASAVGRLAANVAAHRDDVGAVTLVVDDEPQLALINTPSANATTWMWDVKRLCVIGPRATTRGAERVQPLVVVEET
jgi:hypothetical protein